MRFTERALISAAPRKPKSTLPMADGTGWEMFIFKRTRHTTEQGVELEARRPQKMLFLGKLEEKPDKFYTDLILSVM
jgi:hypothetical protein